MEYINLSETLIVSRFIQGLMRIPSWNFSKIDLLNHLEKLQDLGITTLDNADIYGNYECEKNLGDALSLKPAIRDKIQIITKCGIKLLSDKYPRRKIKYYDTSKEHIIASVNQSLINMKTNYIDLLLIHRPDPFMNPFEVSEAFNYLHKSGKVLNFGVSNFKPSSFNLLQKFVKQPLVTNQIEISPLNISSFLDGTIELCQEYEIPPIAWGVLTGGKIFSSASDKAINICNTLEAVADNHGINSIDTIIYAFLLNHPVKIIPLIGTSKITRIQNAIDALQVKLTREEWYQIYIASLGKDVD